MDRDDNRKMDEGLQGNEKIEQAIRELQQAPSGEELAHTLTVVRRRMKEGGQFIVAGRWKNSDSGNSDGRWAAMVGGIYKLRGRIKGEWERNVHIPFGYGKVIHSCIGDRRDKRCYRKSLEPHIDDGQESDPDCVGKSTFLTVRPGIQVRYIEKDVQKNRGNELWRLGLHLKMGSDTTAGRAEKRISPEQTAWKKNLSWRRHLTVEWRRMA